MKKREFQYIDDKSRKFWIIHPPQKTYPDGMWAISVDFGRIGTEGQTHTKLYAHREAAVNDYHHRCQEKLAKGYKEKKALKIKPLLVAPAPIKIPAPCKHDNLKRSGSKWKCKACKTTIEFDKPQAGTEAEVEKKVRRFINLDWRKTA